MFFCTNKVMNKVMKGAAEEADGKEMSDKIRFIESPKPP